VSPVDPESQPDAESFVSLLVHELRTPLTALRGSLGLLGSSVEDVSPDARNFAAIADRNAAALASLLDDVAEYIRCTEAAAVPARETSDVTAVVQRAIEDVQAFASARGATLEPPAGSALADVDPALLRRAVVRLLLYAVAVSPPAAVIRIDVRAEAPEALVITVSDHGRAVDAAAVSRVCEPFSPAARRSAERSVKPGLGLAIAARIAALHGGALGFSQTGEGGCFTLRVPTR